MMSGSWGGGGAGSNRSPGLGSKVRIIFRVSVISVSVIGTERADEVFIDDAAHTVQRTIHMGDLGELA